MVVVEVRQGTLGVDGRGWGPAENTVDRGSQLDEDDEDDEDDKDDKDDKEDEEDEEERRRRRRTRQEEATDIKSNNPHLAGEEKQHVFVSCCICKENNMYFKQNKENQCCGLSNYPQI